MHIQAVPSLSVGLEIGIKSILAICTRVTMIPLHALPTFPKWTGVYLVELGHSIRQALHEWSPTLYWECWYPSGGWMTDVLNHSIPMAKQNLTIPKATVATKQCSSDAGAWNVRWMELLVCFVRDAWNMLTACITCVYWSNSSWTFAAEFLSRQKTTVLCSSSNFTSGLSSSSWLLAVARSREFVD